MAPYQKYIFAVFFAIIYNQAERVSKINSGFISYLLQNEKRSSGSKSTVNSETLAGEHQKPDKPNKLKKLSKLNDLKKSNKTSKANRPKKPDKLNKPNKLDQA
jgi:hypothetical protein